MALKITLNLEGAFAVIRMRGFAGDRWGAFRLAIEGAIYNKPKKANYATLDKVPGIIVRLREADFPVECDGALTRALAEHTTQLWNDVQAAKERARAFDEAMAQRIDPKTGKPFYLYTFQYSGITWLSTKFGGLLADDMGTGKLSGVTEPVMTPSGWRTMGDLRVDDYVIGADGLPTRVTGIFPQGVKKLYRVTTTDGAWTRAGAEHLWYVETANTRFRKTKGRVMTTAELVSAGLRYAPSGENRAKDPLPRSRGNSKWFLPIVKPVQLARKDLLVEPYLLGALLANGYLGNCIIHTGLEEQRTEIEKVLPKTIELVHSERFSWTLRSTVSGCNHLTRDLKTLGVHGHRHGTKFVPKDYLTASVEQRLALLQGLCDNDGCVAEDGIHVEFNTISPQLAEDVLELARSLGASASVSNRIPTYEYKGEKLEGHLDHRIRISMSEDMNPFRIPFKRDRFKPRSKYPPTHAIESIEECGEEESVCIRVEAEDHLYVTRDYIVTHNTLQTIAALPANAAVLVVGPKMAKAVWRKELGDWRPHLRVSTLSGRGNFRWPKAGEVVITNYDILPDTHTEQCLSDRADKDDKGKPKKTILTGKHDKNCLKAQADIFSPALQHLAKQCKGCLRLTEVAKECKGCLPFLKEVPENTVLVYDEAHNLTNPKAQRTVKARGLSGAVRAKGGRVWLLTATPLMNHPIELWSVFEAALIAQEVFGDFKTFLRLFDAKAANEFGGYLFGTPDTEAIAERMQRVMLRRRKEDVLQDMPPLTTQVITVDVDSKTLKECDVFVSAHGGVDNILETLDKALDFKSMSKVASVLATAKIPAMLEFVESHEEQAEPLVIFSAHRAPIDILAKRKGWSTITGDTSDKERSRIVEDFQAGKLLGVGCTIRAGGVAITLTRACNMIFVDREWNPALNSQARDRIRRIGQTRPVLIRVLAANHPLDERVTELNLAKQALFDASVDGAREMQDADESLGELGTTVHEKIDHQQETGT